MTCIPHQGHVHLTLVLDGCSIGLGFSYATFTLYLIVFPCFPWRPQRWHDFFCVRKTGCGDWALLGVWVDVWNPEGCCRPSLSVFNSLLLIRILTTFMSYVCWPLPPLIDFKSQDWCPPMPPHVIFWDFDTLRSWFLLIPPIQLSFDIPNASHGVHSWRAALVDLELGHWMSGNSNLFHIIDVECTHWCFSRLSPPWKLRFWPPMTLSCLSHNFARPSPATSRTRTFD